MELTNTAPKTMAGNKSYAERMDVVVEDEQPKKMQEESGLRAIGTHLNNTQILEREFVGENGPAESKLDDEDVEVEMVDDNEGTPLEPDTTQRGKYAEEGSSPEKHPSDSAALFGIEPKRSSFKRADRSQSPRKTAPYPDLSQSMSSQGSKNGPPVPPKHGGSKSMVADPSLRQAFRSKKPVEELSMEEMENETKAYESGQKLHKLPKRPSTPRQSDDEFESADESPESTLKQRFKASKTEAEILRNEVFMLKKELRETQDHIFSMQPRAQGLTESDAVADFNSLTASVTEWVESKLGDSIEAMLEGNQKVSVQQPAKIVLANTPPPGREAFRYKDTDEHNIAAYIMRCLCEWVLNRDFYCNIEGGATSFLHGIEKAMRNLEPRRDHITVRTWRSETYTAIANRHNFAGQREKLRNQVAYDLVHTLHIFAPRYDQDTMFSSLLTSIVDPCLALAHKIHLSVDKYTIRWTPYHTATWEQRQTMKLDLTQFDCVDLLTGRTFKSQPKGKLLTYICDLVPGLVLEKAQAQFNGEPKILKRPRILVAVTKEEDGFFEPKLPRQGETYTLLGWMEEKLMSRNRFVTSFGM